MALAYLTINLDAFTGDDHPPVPSYSTITLDPGVDHIDAAADVIHVRTIVVSLDRQGKAATANGVPCVDGKVPVVAGVAYAVSAPNILRGGPHVIPALAADEVKNLADVYVPGVPLTPDQALGLAAQIAALSEADADHVAEPDPHPQYTTAAEAGAAAPVQSVAGKTGAVKLTASDVGAATAAQGAKADTAVQPAALTGFGSEFAALIATLAAAEQSTAVQIIGDSTGNSTDEWVHLTAQWLAAAYPTHRVEHRIWDSTSQDYLAPLVVQAGPSGERYLVGDGTARVVCEPDTAANSITGDIDIRVDVSLDSWTQTATENAFVSKFGGGGQRTLRFSIGGGYNKPYFEWSADGSTLIGSQPTTWTAPADGARKWLRVTLDVDNGASGRTVRFYDSTDGVTWTQIGADVTTAGVTSLFDSTTDWQAGARGGSLGGGPMFRGKLYHVEVRNGINGPLVLPAKPEAWTIQAPNPPTYGGSPTVTFVNGSHPGASMTYLLDATRFQRMTPNYGQSLAIVSCSHNDSTRTGTAYLADWTTMLANLRAKFPLAGIAASTQNPKTAPATNIREHTIRAAQIIGWASRNRVGVVDARRAFSEDARGLAVLLASDGVHPTAAGSQLWADTVTAALAPHMTTT